MLFGSILWCESESDSDGVRQILVTSLALLLTLDKLLNLPNLSFSEKSGENKAYFLEPFWELLINKQSIPAVPNT